MNVVDGTKIKKKPPGGGFYINRWGSNVSQHKWCIDMFLQVFRPLDFFILLALVR